MKKIRLLILIAVCLMAGAYLADTFPHMKGYRHRVDSVVRDTVKDLRDRAAEKKEDLQKKLLLNAAESEKGVVMEERGVIEEGIAEVEVKPEAKAKKGEWRPLKPAEAKKAHPTLNELGVEAIDKEELSKPLEVVEELDRGALEALVGQDVEVAKRAKKEKRVLFKPLLMK